MSRRRYKRARADSASREIELAQPDRSMPTTKTLYNVVAERQTVFFDGSTAEPVLEESPVATSILYAITLSMLHFTLDVLVYHQYAQEILWRMILFRVVITFPVFATIVLVLRTGPLARLQVIRQLLLLLSACIAGCYLIKSGNRAPYLAVMKQAPPLGSLWVLSVVEMKLSFAVGHLGIIAIYVSYMGFSVF